jgi:uncharacterized protein YdcH (DUF465 family)
VSWHQLQRHTFLKRCRMVREESATGTSSRLADLHMKVELLKELGDEELDESRINQMKRARLALFDELMNTVDESRSRGSN